MNILYFFLTVLMFLDCLILILLVLLQLPKKDAGAGLAFGGGATDALFGAGAGNVLTKITKYAAGLFFAFALTMAVVAAHQRSASGASELQEELMKAPAVPAAAPAASTPGNAGVQSMPLLSNLPPAAKPAAPATNK